MPVVPEALPTSRPDRLQKPLHCCPHCQRLDMDLRQRLLQANPLPGSLLQEGASCGPSCGPASASKPGLQAHFMCEQLAHRVRQLSLEKQVRLLCLAAASFAGEVPVIPVHAWRPEVDRGALPPDLEGRCNRRICTVHLFKRAQQHWATVVLEAKECWSCCLPSSNVEQKKRKTQAVGSPQEASAALGPCS